MTLSNIADWNDRTTAKTGDNASKVAERGEKSVPCGVFTQEEMKASCGADAPKLRPAACGAEAPSEKKSAPCDIACGASDKPEA